MYLLNRKIQFFNMIEVLLALAVIAVGMTSILGLFPVGINASRDAVAENSSADVADQMITYLRVINESVKRDPSTNAIIPPTNYDNNIKATGTSAYQESKYSDETVINTQSALFLNYYKTGDVSTTSSTFPRVAEGWSIFRTTTVALLEPQMFFIVQGPNCTGDGGNRNIDYSAMALVWKSAVLFSCNDSALQPSPYIYSGQLNIELSWPLELPYSERKKRYYQIVIAKPK